MLLSISRPRPLPFCFTGLFRNCCWPRAEFGLEEFRKCTFGQKDNDDATAAVGTTATDAVQDANVAVTSYYGC